MEPTANAPSAAPKPLRRIRHRHPAGRALPARRLDHLPVAAPFTYQVYLAVHVIAAVIWVGGDVTLTTLGIVFERRGEGETLAALGRMGSWIGTGSTRPALFVVIGFGIALMLEADLDWGQFWVIFGLIGWTIAGVVGSASWAGARADRRGRADARAESARGRGPRQAPVHDLPLRHGVADPDRDRHDGEADVLAAAWRTRPERARCGAAQLNR